MKFLHSLQNSPIARGFSATLLGSGLSKLIIIILTFYCTNTLAKAEFGEYSLLRNTLNMVLCICALNLSSLCTKFTVEIKSNKDSIYRLLILTAFSLSVCALLGLSLMLLPSNILQSIIGTSNLDVFINILGLLLPAFMLQPLIEGILRGMMRFKLVGILQIVSSLFFLFTTIIGIQLYGFDGAVFCLLAYYTFYTLISLYALEKARGKFKIHSEKSRFKKNMPILRSMILPVFIMSFIEAPILWISQLMLAHYGTTETIGSMTVIMQIRNFTILIPSYFFNTFVAFAGEMNAKKEYASYFNKFRKLIQSFIIYGVFAAIIISVTGNLILSLYGKSYISDDIGLFISNIGIPLLILIGLLKIHMVIQEHQKTLLYISITWNTLWLLLFYIALENGMSPLYAFFATQLVGITLQYVLYQMTYNKDKMRLASC